MLNISNNSVNEYIDTSKYDSFKLLKSTKSYNALIKISAVLGVLALIILFLPWTQNIRARGYVTTLNPYDRPQTIQTVIGGKIAEWYVQEGDIVTAGDTILRITETKQEYFDPQLLQRTQGQIDSKQGAALSYDNKALQLAQQTEAIRQARDAKLQQNQIKVQQTMLKITTDSMSLIAAGQQVNISQVQYDRINGLYEKGIKSLSDKEEKRLKLNESEVKVVELQNKINAHKNELSNLIVGRETIKIDFLEKRNKIESERMSAFSDKFSAEADIDKLQSQFNQYQVRANNYYITSPITGLINQAVQSGIGSIVKDGDDIVTIIPNDYSLAVEMYVRPLDMPLLQIGQEVRVQFDGWPSIVFSGWPNSSYGTFAGEVYAINEVINNNGRYRVLIQPDVENPWPEQIRVGAGANTITLLNDVLIAYEVWRQLNGFPPDYYEDAKGKEFKNKAPLRKVK